MNTDNNTGFMRRFFSHTATRAILFVALVGAFSFYLYQHAQQNGGIKAGFVEEEHSMLELDKATAEKIFNPTLENLQPKPFYLLICDANDMACKLQLKESELAAAQMKEDVTFYHLDPSKNQAVYNAVYKAIVSMVGKPIPQAFPMHTLWKTAFRFNGTVPKAGVGIVNLGENMIPAGGVLQWVNTSLNPPADAAPDDGAQGQKTAPAPKG